jgi:hypothetical protein
MVPETMDRIIAPKISELLAPDPPDISGSRRYPINGFVLNSRLSLALRNRIRQACFNFIRNTEAAFDEYCDARIALLEYPQTRDRTLTPYFSAMRHFEHCLGHLCHAVLSANTFANEKQFEAGDLSVLDRVRILHNHIKHIDEKISKIAIRDENSFNLFATGSDASGKTYEIADVASVPMWLTDKGLECRVTSVTYTELAHEVILMLEEAVDIASLQSGNAKASPSKP